MQSQTLRARLLCTIAGAAILAAMPVSLRIAKPGWSVEPGYAFAKDGSDDDDSGGSGGGGNGGSDDDNGGSGGGGSGGADDDSGGSGGGGSDDSDDDSGGSGGGGSDDSDDDDNSGSGRGGNDDGSGRGGNDDGDDGSGRGGNNDGDDGGRDEGNGGAKVEFSRDGIEVERADGTKEEIENGRYERKDANGRTVEERPATQADIDRLRGLAGVSGVAATRRVASGTVAKVEISRDGIEVVNNDGTKEEIENGRYQRKDASGRTVEERRATQADVDRLQLASRGVTKPARRIEVGAVAKVERSVAGMEIVYSTGWKEEVENGRYELKDPNNNTVVERPATSQDRARMRRLAGG